MADSLNTLSLPENRTDLENLIEAAIARLDAMDGDPDDETEDPDLEPSIGAPEQHFGHWRGLLAHGDDDRELDEADDEDTVDQEQEDELTGFPCLTDAPCNVISFKRSA